MTKNLILNNTQNVYKIIWQNFQKKISAKANKIYFVEAIEKIQTTRALFNRIIRNMKRNNENETQLECLCFLTMLASLFTWHFLCDWLACIWNRQIGTQRKMNWKIASSSWSSHHRTSPPPSNMHVSSFSLQPNNKSKKRTAERQAIFKLQIFQWTYPSKPSSITTKKQQLQKLPHLKTCNLCLHIKLSLNPS